MVWSGDLACDAALNTNGVNSGTVNGVKRHKAVNSAYVLWLRCTRFLIAFAVRPAGEKAASASHRQKQPRSASHSWQHVTDWRCAAAHTHTNAHTLSHSHTISHTRSHALTLTLSLSHNLSLTLTPHTHTHTHTHPTHTTHTTQAIRGAVRLTVINPPTRSLVWGSSSLVPSWGEYNSVVRRISSTRSSASATGIGLLSWAALMMFITYTHRTTTHTRIKTWVQQTDKHTHTHTHIRIKTWAQRTTITHTLTHRLTTHTHTHTHTHSHHTQTHTHHTTS